MATVKKVENKDHKKVKNEIEIKELNVLQRLNLFQLEDIQILKSKKAYGYYYADLDNILTCIKPYLQKYRLSIYHTVSSKIIKNEITGISEIKNELITNVYNIDNIEDYICCSTIIDEKVKLAKQNEFMVIGSAITYFRRYHVVTMFGLTTDEDSDAGGVSMQDDKPGNDVTNKVKGKSVDNVKSESNVDYLKIFDNLIKAKSKTKDQLIKMLKNYKSKINESDYKKIEDLINNK